MTYKELHIRNEEIRKLRDEGWMLKDLSEKYNIAVPQISLICTNNKPKNNARRGRYSGMLG